MINGNKKILTKKRDILEYLVNHAMVVTFLNKIFPDINYEFPTL